MRGLNCQSYGFQVNFTSNIKHTRVVVWELTCSVLPLRSTGACCQLVGVQQSYSNVYSTASLQLGDSAAGSQGIVIGALIAP
jgi:hypothetical protein